MEQIIGYVFEFGMDKVFSYLNKSYLELSATIFGFIYIYFSIRGDIKLWVFGLLSSGLFTWVFFKSKVYADMGIQIYYVFISIYGWVHWYFYRDQRKEEIPVKNLNLKQWLFAVVATGLIFILIGVFLDNVTDSDIPYWDAFTTSAGIVATWMLARKILEQWLIWIIVDFVSVFLYLYKDLYFASVLSVVYTILAIIGFFEWRKVFHGQMVN
jgi:nicotinamide mononucleotide transporter